MVFELGGKKVQVNTYTTSWPLSVFYKRQGVGIKINPHGHWWCLWLCSSTDDVDAIACSIVLHSALVADATAMGSCTDCGDLTVKGPATGGFSAPWAYGSVDFRGSITIGEQSWTFNGSLVFS